MLDIKYIRDNPDKVKQVMQDKHVHIDLYEFLNFDIKRREILKEAEKLKADRNSASKEIGQIKKNKGDASALMLTMQNVSAQIHELDNQLRQIEQSQQEIALCIPNIPHISTPHGDATANVIVREFGQKPELSFKPKSHWELGEVLDILDLKASAQITGSGFVLFKNAGALLERALINMMLDLHVQEHGFKEVAPPFIVNRNSMIGTGQLPKLEDDMYHIDNEDLFLIPTAEVPVTNIHRNDVLRESDLPVQYVAYTPCFRREAGSYGKDTRGINRVHQFDKVEMVQFVKPEDSYKHLEELVGFAEKVLQTLNLHYRVVLLADGDISFAASKCYDLEVWASGQDSYLEVSSCSNFEDFQARRINVKYKDSNNKLHFVHTLNGSGIALARTVIAILENFQNDKGEIVVPEALIPYMRGLNKIKIS